MSTVYFNDIADFMSNPVDGGKTFCENFSNNCTQAVCVKFDPAVTTGEAQDATNIDRSTFEIVACDTVPEADLLANWTGGTYVRAGDFTLGVGEDDTETVHGHIMQRPGMQLTQRVNGTDTEALLQTKRLS